MTVLGCNLAFAKDIAIGYCKGRGRKKKESVNRSSGHRWDGLRFERGRPDGDGKARRHQYPKRKRYPHRRIEMRLQQAGFQETCRLEDFDWSASITLNRRLLDAVFSLEFLDKHEHVLLVGPAGVGKSFLAQALGYAAVRSGHTVRFIHADDFFKTMAQARVDNSVERTFRSFLAPDLLILDDLGLHRFTAQQSADLYELILNRYRASSFIITERDPDQSLTVEDYAVRCADIVTTIPLMGGIDALTEHTIKEMSRLKAPPELEGYHNTALKIYQELQKEGSFDRVSRSTLMEAEREIDALSPSLINYLITTGCITG